MKLHPYILCTSLKRFSKDPYSDRYWVNIFLFQTVLCDFKVAHTDIVMEMYPQSLIVESEINATRLKQNI